MRKLLIGGALGAPAAVLATCCDSRSIPSSDVAMQRQADVYDISQIERSFHESMATKNINEMMGLWMQNATFTYGPGLTATGKEQIRKTWLKSPSFQPATQWAADHPAY